MNKKNVCFITLGNLYLCPYLKKYTSIIDCDYDVIYWDRHCLGETSNGKKTYRFEYKMTESKNKISKLIGYLKFRRYAKKIIDINGYDAIILLQTSTGILLQNILTSKYKGRYIIDIRDYTLERNRLFYIVEKKLIENSGNTIISSKGFKKFLPEYNYTLVNNNVNIEDEILEKIINRQKNNEKIIISYIGLIRFHEQNKKIILKFKNDNRFELRFIGKDACFLKEFCENNNVKNVKLRDQFKPEKTLNHYYETDIINNLYGNKTPLLDYALSNKLYYAAQLNMPILVCPETYMATVSTEYGFGYIFDIENEDACDELYNYYISINKKELKEKCSQFNKQVKKENAKFEIVLRNFIQEL